MRESHIRCSMFRFTQWALLVATAAACGAGNPGLNQTSVTCPAGRTLLDGVCVSEPVADYVACVRAQGATLGGSKREQISADVGTVGVHAGGAAELSETLEKKYATSDNAMLEIVRKCSASVEPTARASAATPKAAAAGVDLTTVPRATTKVGHDGVLVVNRGYDGPTLLVAGQTFATGFLAHADSELTFDLGGKYALFTATVGLADSATPCYKAGTSHAGDGAKFVVEVDGVQRFQSAALRISEIQNVSVDLTNAKRVTLRTLVVGNNYCDHTVWGVPKLVPSER